MENLVSVDSQFWKGRRVFVTGHTGFKGSWLSLWLQELGADVTGYALAPPTRPALFELVDVAGGMNSIIADVLDTARLQACVRETSPEIVFHLAAQSLVRRSYVDPVDTWSVNVMGTLHLLEAVKATPAVRAVVVVTSDKCYENREWPWPYRENEPMGGSDPYSASKGAAELLVASYRRSYFAPARHKGALATARAGNVIGGGDFAEDRLIPDLVRGAIARKPVIIRKASSVRPWQHVLDPLAGYLTLAERLHADGESAADAWNFGPSAEDQKSVAEVADGFVSHWPENASWQALDTGGPHEAGLLALDSTKARLKLGWRPKWGFEKALAQTVRWYRATALAPSEARALTLEQLREY